MTQPPWADPPEPDERPEPEPGPGLPPGVELPDDEDEQIDVQDIMDVNAGDEHHLDENWRACPRCGVDGPADYSHCWSCNADWGDR